MKDGITQWQAYQGTMFDYAQQLDELVQNEMPLLAALIAPDIEMAEYMAG